MKFNYMLPKEEQIKRCVGEKRHYYVPTKHIEAVIGHVAVRFRCKRCGQLATAFLEKEHYKPNEKLLNSYGG